MPDRPPRFAESPLTEALVGFTFDQAEPGDLTLPGLLFKEIERDFPDKEREARSVLDPESEAPEVMRFFRGDRTALVRAGEGALSVHHIRNHPGWESLRALALKQLRTYCDLAHPKGIKTATVRYVNRVNLPGPQGTFSEYFNLSLPWSNEVVEGDEPFRDLYIQATLPYPADQVDLQVYLVHLPAEGDERFSYVLDLLAGATEPLGVDAVEPWLDRAHQRIRAFFEHAFTDKARSGLFKEIPSS